MQFVVFPVLSLVEVAQNQSWTRDKRLASRQRNRVSGTKQNSKNVKVSVTRWSSHNEYSNNAKTSNFVAWKHRHVVAAVLCRAQLAVSSFLLLPEPGEQLSQILGVHVGAGTPLMQVIHIHLQHSGHRLHSVPSSVAEPDPDGSKPFKVLWIKNKKMLNNKFQKEVKIYYLK